MQRIINYEKKKCFISKKEFSDYNVDDNKKCYKLLLHRKI